MGILQSVAHISSAEALSRTLEDLGYNTIKKPLFWILAAALG